MDFEVSVVVEVDGVGGGGVKEVEGDHGAHDGPWVGLGGVEDGLAVCAGSGDDASEGREAGYLVGIGRRHFFDRFALNDTFD